MADTHPILEAVAAALWEADPRDPRGTSWRSYLPDALVAARVILSATPTMTDDLTMVLGAAYGRSYGRGGGSPHKHALAALVRAYNAALLREIEGAGNG